MNPFVETVARGFESVRWLPPPYISRRPYSSHPPAVSTDSFHDRLQSSLGAAYSLTRELGGGGMSRVFLAREVALERDVVVKVLSPDLTAGVSAARFTREIKLAASLQQANIVPLLAAGETDGLPYYTMPFVDGLSLRARLERHGALPVGEAVSVLRDVTRALAYAHEHGVVHRDIKPENILLSGNAAVVTDFGIAKALAASTTRAPGATLTQLGTSIGTPAYMAPEQAAGDPATDHRADLYALGCVAYEMLTGAAPFAGRTLHQLFAAHMMETPVSLATLRTDVPLPLAQLVSRCLEKDHARRPQSARDVLAALDAIGFGSGATPSNASHASTQRRWPVAMVSAAVGVIALATAAAFGGGALRARGAIGDTSSADRTIAVLPFENLGDPADAYFADGVTDAVRGKLGELPGMRVIARASSNQYRASTKTPQQIGAELGVQYLLTATVRWEKNGAGGVSRVQVRPELVAVRNAESKWQEPFDAALTDVFQVQADIAGRVANKLDVALGDSAKRGLAAAPTTNLAAYDAYLKAQAATAGGTQSNTASLIRAVELLERAVALDSTFASAWTALAGARSLLYQVGASTPEAAAQAKAATERASALAPGRTDEVLARAAYYRYVAGDYPRAVTLYEAGLRVAPNDAPLLTAAASAEKELGRWELGLDFLRRARAVDPRSPATAAVLASTLLGLRRIPEARVIADSALSLAPSSLNVIETRAKVSLADGDLAGARAVLRSAPASVDRTALFAEISYHALSWTLDDAAQRVLLSATPSAFGEDRSMWGIALASTYALRGNRLAARSYADSSRLALIPQMPAAPNDAGNHIVMGLALAYGGHGAEAMAEGERATHLLPVNGNATRGYYFEELLAQIYTMAGEREKALNSLERLLRLPGYVTPAWLRINPNYAPLRGNPRFERMLGRR